MTVAYVALGSNLGKRQQNINSAVDAIAALPLTELLQRSSIYESPAFGDSNAPDYLNAVVSVDTQLAPTELMRSLLNIECQHGRRRQRRWAPRILDCDLLLYGSFRCQTPFLTLPHPRMHSRDFVLVPLAQLCPKLFSPMKNQEVTMIV